MIYEEILNPFISEDVPVEEGDKDEGTPTEEGEGGDGNGEEV